jgi:hypothetical protein
MQKKSQRTPRTTTERVFSSNLTTPGLSFTAELQGKTGTAAASDTSGGSGRARQSGNQGHCRLTSARTADNRSVSSGPNVNSSSLDKMSKVVETVVQQIMTEFNGAVLEEAKLLDITKIVLNFIEQNGHKNS